ncbi:NADAR family protein [Azospirillum picis]|uniref:RibA/ribD-fused uncharacterized protein n=1 Tax=Azospirillum picis TaxID=488438 RepID=A0ABU0MIK2_9PROT|nr:NADAR family protein [Azospirillum picis]MBP2299229.1 ribA/ribD-fused uncharacterized protein [Azospirillum picis]MDQ0533133.1 ribA/ribD-fused uncharacterized protein [Azospirillum picis]
MIRIEGEPTEMLQAQTCPITSFQGPYRFLSNMWPCRIEWEGIEYGSTEHAYQASKTTDMAERNRIAAICDPMDAKEEGRKLTVRSDWDELKRDVMTSVIRLKFADPELAGLLLATGDRKLIEGNDWGDRIWGECPLGVGTNWLGIILMEERLRLKEYRRLGTE